MLPSSAVWQVTLASTLVCVKIRIGGNPSVISFTVSLSNKCIICLLIHLNYDPSIPNKQSRSVTEIFSVSARNERQYQYRVKDSKIAFLLFQIWRQCGGPGGNGLCHGWAWLPRDTANGGAIRLQNERVVFDRSYERDKSICKCDRAQR
jgi:hypothetical protein